MKITGISVPTRPFIDNEDWLGSAQRMAVVLDGCGVPDVLKDSVDRGCAHGLPWFVATLGTALLRHGADGNAPLPDALARAIQDTVVAHGQRCDLDLPTTPAATVAVLRQGPDAVEYLVLGDAAVIIDDGAGEPMVVSDHRMDELALPGYGTASPGGAEHDRITALRTRRIAESRNQPGGYPIASRDPQAAYQALTGSRAGGRRALVASDGATRIVDLFADLTWTGLLDVAQTHGPEEIVQRTRALEDADPDGDKWPRGKRYDDVTLALCEF